MVKMTVHDFMGDSPAAVLAEVLQGVFDGYQDSIEITEAGAHVHIKNEQEGWILTLRKMPSLGSDVSREIETTS